MPYSAKQTRYLLSKSSPLTGDQRSKMLVELHDNPAMAHAKKKADHQMNPLTGKRRKG